LISSLLQRRRRRLPIWAIVVSALLHLLVLGIVLRHYQHMLVQERGETLRVVRQKLTIEKAAVATPQPVLQQPQQQQQQQVQQPQKVQPHSAPPPEAPPAPHELAREEPNAPPQPPQTHHPSALSVQITHDEARFANEVAQLNKGNDPHAVPTIDPAAREPSMKTYGFVPPHGLGGGDSPGNGLITPTSHWSDHGLDCYYGRYSYNYPSGGTEEGTIAWPFCYEPGSDPFKVPPHPIPFPLPLPGYKLPAGTDLPPIEKDIYDQWIAGNG
jgi:hypothetical protein